MRDSGTGRAAFLLMGMLTAFSFSGESVCRAQASGEITLTEGVGIPPVGRSGRGAAHTDALEAQIVAGRWKMPQAGDTLAMPDGRMQTWIALHAAKDNVFRGPAMQGGYAAFTVAAEAPKVMLLDAAGHNMVYVNGEPRIGDVYQTGWTLLPVALHPGKNDLLFQCGRGELRAKLISPASPALLNMRDLTLPDLLVGEKTQTVGGLLVINATDRPMNDLALHVEGQGLASTTTPVPSLPPLSIRKVMFRLRGAAPAASGTEKVHVLLLEKNQRKPLDTAQFDLRIRKPNETRKITFISDIDGSVQYYAVNPAQTNGKPANNLALFLSLHGASVEAIGQADAYSPKSWGNIVAPTNRRPYGFDWEDWGRLDALEVLERAKQTLHPDPQRIYLTGHSMGGHGTWHLGVTFPDQFAAIGPSAGWISFFSYAGAVKTSSPTPMQEMLLRAMQPSDTLSLKQNYAQEGVYILHGTADDNVPVAQAREMSKELAAFHHDFVLFEQPGAGHWWDAHDEPGADCVDWMPMFDFFARHARPVESSVREIDFTTADPGVSARCHWACIEAQGHSLLLSSVSLHCDPALHRISGKTENVARLSLSLDPIPVPGPLTVILDDQKIENLPWPSSTKEEKPTIWLTHEAGKWEQASRPSPLVKNPERCGPFKQAFRNRMLLVYGTKGTPEENEWAYARARYDAEGFWYRGNGSIEMQADTAFDPGRERDRNIIVYGNADTNAAWKGLLAESPVVVNHQGVQIGERHLEGGDLACLCVRPRPGSDRASVGFVGGTGLTGMRLTDRIPYFVSGVEYPDCVVFSSEVLTKGAAAVRAAGSFGPDWSVNSGEFVWQ